MLKNLRYLVQDLVASSVNSGHLLLHLREVLQLLLDFVEFELVVLVVVVDFFQSFGYNALNMLVQLRELLPQLVQRRGSLNQARVSLALV